MADGEKPYRVYKGGRTRGKVPPRARPEREQRRRDDRAAEAAGRPRWGRRIGLAALALVVLLVVWFVARLPLVPRRRRGGEREAAEDGRSANLAPQDGALISKPSLILLLGTDGDRKAAARTRAAPTRSCSLRTDPGRHRLAYLSIPRDLRVDIPGYGANKINAAYQLGGPALTLKTVTALTGLHPNHVVLPTSRTSRP